MTKQTFNETTGVHDYRETFTSWVVNTKETKVEGASKAASNAARPLVTGIYLTKKSVVYKFIFN